MVNSFRELQILNAPRCELVVFGSGAWAFKKLRSVAPFLPPHARVIVFDDQSFPPVSGDNDNQKTNWLKDIAQHWMAEFWRWRTRAEISVRYGCQVVTCEERVDHSGKLEMVIHYRSGADPDRERLLKADRVIWTLGFTQLPWTASPA